MLFKRLSRDLPEQVFVVVENNEGATIAKDQTVQMDNTTEADGIKARDMDTGALYCFQGLADAAIADGGYGLVQVYGYRSTSKVFQTDTSLAAGAPLVPVAAQEYLQTVASTIASNAAVTLQPFYAALLESVASSSASAAASAKIFIRAL
jgi:hypothetical protein